MASRLYRKNLTKLLIRVKMSDIQFVPSTMSKKIAKRQAIIESAIEVFGKNHFRKGSISEIARKAGVAEGTIYQYFKNKEDLFFSIPIEKTKEFCRNLDLHLEGITGAFNRIRKFIWWYLYFFQANPQYSRTLMLEMRVNKSFSKAKAFKSFKPFTNKILEIIKEGRREGILRQDVNVYLQRQLILGVLEHMVTRWLLKGERYDLVKHYEGVCALVFNGISFPKGPGNDSNRLTREI
jgi:TetR/AcrR family transcriptional regulator, fatty acid metabolism regulator protein